MSIGSQVSAFCRDISKTKMFWTIQFQDGSYIKWRNEDGSEIFPLWSTETRVQRTLKVATELEGGSPVSISFDNFIQDWLPELVENSVLLGPNWAGENLTGTSFDAMELITRVETAEEFDG